MTEFKNTERELHYFRLRLSAVGVFVFLCFCVLLARFVWLQVVKHDDYVAQAEDNRISVVPVVPNRGLIIDRNGVVLARNFSAYTLEITPSKVDPEVTLDALIDKLSEVVEIQPKDRKRFRKKLEESKQLRGIAIRTRLTDEEVARFSAQRFRFPGVEIQARLFRQYPLGSVASHVIGYISHISQADEDKIDDSDDSANYNGTEYIGKEGVEHSYETQLHGTTGYEEVEVSAGGRPVRTLSRTPSSPGNNLILSIDIELQKIVEDAFGDRRGAFVAIEPETGDILAYVSKPTYDPNLFVDGIDQQSWDELNKSADLPLVNRPLTGIYPPGSTYKPFMALAALELGKRTTTWALADTGAYVLGNHTFFDDVRGGHGMVDMYRSIVHSCDIYYFGLANDLGVDAIHDFMEPFGYGRLTGIDLDGERKGILPSTAWKKAMFKSPQQQRWVAGDTISLGIGQGFNTFTPLQMASAIATLANNGVVMKPHLVKLIENGVTHERTKTVPKESFRIPLHQENIDFIKHAMAGVPKEGTSRAAFLNAGYESAGKTGTAQVVNIKRNEKHEARKASGRFKDNALYSAFAPLDHPRIALIAVVENAGFGAQEAAPIARKALDYYLLGKRPDGSEKVADDKGDPPDQSDPETLPSDEDAANVLGPAEAPAPGAPTSVIPSPASPAAPATQATTKPIPSVAPAKPVPAPPGPSPAPTPPAAPVPGVPAAPGQGGRKP